MKRLLAMGAAVCALGPAADALGGQEAAGAYFEAGYQHFFVDGASLGADGLALRVPDHSYGVLMARGGYDVLPFVTLEAEAMVGVVDGDPTVESPLGDIPVKARIEYGLAAFAVSCFSHLGRCSHERQTGTRHAGAGYRPARRLALETVGDRERRRRRDRPWRSPGFRRRRWTWQAGIGLARHGRSCGTRRPGTLRARPRPVAHWNTIGE